MEHLFWNYRLWKCHVSHLKECFRNDLRNHFWLEFMKKFITSGWPQEFPLQLPRARARWGSKGEEACCGACQRSPCDDGHHWHVLPGRCCRVWRKGNRYHAHSLRYRCKNSFWRGKVRNFRKGAPEKGYLHKIVRNWLSNSRQICDNFAHPSSDVRNEIPAILRKFWRAICDKFARTPRSRTPPSRDFWKSRVRYRVVMQAEFARFWI